MGYSNWGSPFLFSDKKEMLKKHLSKLGTTLVVVITIKVEARNTLLLTHPYILYSVIDKHRTADIE